jgi:hypothetical protein
MSSLHGKMGRFRNAFFMIFMAGVVQVQFSPELVAYSGLGESASGHHYPYSQWL